MRGTKARAIRLIKPKHIRVRDMKRNYREKGEVYQRLIVFNERKLRRQASGDSEQ